MPQGLELEKKREKQWCAFSQICGVPAEASRLEHNQRLKKSKKQGGDEGRERRQMGCEQK